MFQMQMRVQPSSSMSLLCVAAGMWTVIRVFLWARTWLVLRPVKDHHICFNLIVQIRSILQDIGPTVEERNPGVDP